MNIKDSYLHGGTHLVKDISFSADSGVLKATITWAQEGVDNTVLTFPSIGGALFGSQTKNYVLAAPNGSNGNPTFRALVAADISSGTFAAARLPLATNSARGAVLLGVAQTSDADNAVTGKKYWVKMNANGKLFVDVPWADNTHSVTGLYIGNSTTTAKSNAATTDPYIKLFDDNNNRSLHQLKGSLGLGVESDSDGNTTFTNKGPVYFVVGTGTTAGTWTGSIDGLTAYYDGLTIAYYINIAGASSTTLNINSLGAKTCYYTNLSTLTTHYGVGSVIILTYYNNAWRRCDYNSDTPACANQYFRYKVNANGRITKYTFVMKCPDGTITSLTTVTNGTTETSKPMFTGALLLGSVYYYNHTDSFAANGTFTRDGWNSRDNQGLVDTRYTFNCGLTLTANQPFFIVFTKNADGYCYLDTTLPWQCGVPSEDSDKIYLHIGVTYDNYRTTLETVNRAYVKQGGIFRLYSSDPNTHYTAVPILGGTSATSNATSNTANDATFLNIIENGTKSGGILITGATGASVKANNGVLTITSKWLAANSSLEGYAPKLVSGGVALASSANDYILAFTYASSGTLTPTWKKLPSNAYSNTTYTLKIGTAANASNVVTLLSGTGTTSGTIITNSAYNASSNKIATMTDVNNAVTSMFKFQNNTSARPTGTQKVGYAYRVDTAFTLEAAYSVSGNDEILEVGDLLICTDATTPKYLVLNTNWTVTNNAPTLGTSATTIATIGGVNITASLPTAARGTAGVVSLPTGSTTVKFLREDGQWVTPAYTTNTDKTGIKLATVSGTKKTDSTVIITNSSTGLSIAGGTNKFSIGDGTNYIEVAVTPSITNNVTGSGTNAYLVKWTGANTIGNLVAISSAVSSQTQSTKFLREDGTWAAPSYTSDTVRPIYTGGTSQFTNSLKTAINFIGAGATSVTFLAAGTGDGRSGNANYASIKISSNNDLVKFSAITTDTEYYLPVRVKNTTDTALQLYRTSIIVKNSTITASLSGNATTASNLSKGTSRGYLYQSAATATSLTGVGSVNAATKIGIPYIGHNGSANTYGLYEDLFYLSSSTKYLGNSVKSKNFAYVKSKNSTTDDWTGSSTSGSLSGSGNTYSAGDGISINNGVISATRKEWYGTEALFNSIPSLDSNTTYYITAD